MWSCQLFHMQCRWGQWSVFACCWYWLHLSQKVGALILHLFYLTRETSPVIFLANLPDKSVWLFYSGLQSANEECHNSILSVVGLLLEFQKCKSFRNGCSSSMHSCMPVFFTTCKYHALDRRKLIIILPFTVDKIFKERRVTKHFRLLGYVFSSAFCCIFATNGLFTWVQLLLISCHDNRLFSFTELGSFIVVIVTISTLEQTFSSNIPQLNMPLTSWQLLQVDNNYKSNHYLPHTCSYSK